MSMELEAKTKQDVVNLLQTAIADEFSGHIRGPNTDRCETIYERVFLLWWIGLYIAERFDRMAFNRDWKFPCRCPQAQQEIKCGGDQIYRADFTIGFCAIEIDGHEFHEKTPTQVLARNRRDEYLQRAGWTVLHCSNHELLKNPRVAVMRVARAVYEIERARQAAVYELARRLSEP